MKALIISHFILICLTTSTHGFSTPTPNQPKQTSQRSITIANQFLKNLNTQQNAKTLANQSKTPFLTHIICLDSTKQVQNYFSAIIEDTLEISSNPSDFQFDNFRAITKETTLLEEKILYDLVIKNLNYCNITDPIDVILVNQSITTQEKTTANSITVIVDIHGKIRGFY